MTDLEQIADGLTEAQREVWIWFASNGNIRKWSHEPFPEGVRYLPAYEPFWENPDGPTAA